MRGNFKNEKLNIDGNYGGLSLPILFDPLFFFLVVTAHVNFVPIFFFFFWGGGGGGGGWVIEDTLD